MKPTLRIGVFVGNDITSHLILNRMVKKLIGNCDKFYIFLTYKNLSGNESPEIKKLYFYERALLNEYVYPFLDSKPTNEKAHYNSPKQLKNRYPSKVVIKKVKNVNHKSFIKTLSKNKINIGVSIRCYQKFGKDIINHFNKHKFSKHSFFVNLHPGLLPMYRGVITFCRAMQNGEKKAGFTLHHINERWDSGAIIAKRSMGLDYSISVIENMCKQHNLAAGMLVASINKTPQSNKVSSRDQKETLARYYTHPTKEDFTDFKKKAIRLVDKKGIIHLLVSIFTLQDSPERKQLYKLLMNATKLDHR